MTTHARFALPLAFTLVWSVAVDSSYAQSSEPNPSKQSASSLERFSGQLLYTTYFYTATEAVVHAFADGTEARIISMERGGTVWSKTLQAGQTAHVPTGRGVFSFVSNKKAGILVGTPSSCAVVGYWLRNSDGQFRANRFFSRLPGGIYNQDERVIVWAWEDTTVTIRNQTSGKVLHEAVSLKALERFEIPAAQLAQLANQDLSFEAQSGAFSVQVYYDEGFFVPSREGRGSGRFFQTYVGNITAGHNDLSLMSYGGTAKVRVMDLKTGQDLWAGSIEGGTMHTLRLSQKHVRITSDRDISVLVAPNGLPGYAEHHFGVGAEGTGIETDFMLTTPGELWIFSYYPSNPITITDLDSGQLVSKKVLQQGQVFSQTGRAGRFRVRSQKGISVMGGASACGAEFSPAANLFEVDEALFAVIAEIKEERRQQAKDKGQTLTEAQLNAPLSKSELKKANKAVQSRTGRSQVADEEISDRLQSIQSQSPE